MKRFLNVFIYSVLVGYLFGCSPIETGSETQIPTEGLDSSPQAALSGSAREVEPDRENGSGNQADLSILEEPSNGEPGSIVTIWHGVLETEILTLREIVNSFQSQHPEIQINLEYIPYDDLYSRYTEAVNSGQGPSLMLGAGEWGLSLYLDGMVADLKRFKSSALMSEIIPPAAEAVTYKEALFGLPITAEGIVMFRNSKLIPTTPRTFEGLTSISQAATRGENVGAYLERGELFALPQLTACGGVLMLDDGYPTFNNQAGLCWIDLLRSFEEAGPVSFNGNDDLNRFVDGNVGIIFAGTWNIGMLSEALGENLAIDPWPQYDQHNLSGYVWSENIYLNPILEETDGIEAILVMEYLLSSESQCAFANLGLIPIRMNLEDITPLTSQAIQSLSEGVPYRSHPIMETYLDVFNDTLRAVYNQEVSPSDALQMASDRIIKATRDFQNIKDDF